MQNVNGERHWTTVQGGVSLATAVNHSVLPLRIVYLVHERMGMHNALPPSPQDGYIGRGDIDCFVPMVTAQKNYCKKHGALSLQLKALTKPTYIIHFVMESPIHCT